METIVPATLTVLRNLVQNQSLAAFREPRGIMRLFHFIFAVAAIVSVTNYQLDVRTDCTPAGAITPAFVRRNYAMPYPFAFAHDICTADDAPVALAADQASDAQFFVATGVLSALFAVLSACVYAYAADLYAGKPELPLADFMLTGILAVFWLAGTSAWTNGVRALKLATDAGELQRLCGPACRSLTVDSYSGLNVSVIIGFLNVFLWTADLWFLYKETIWFQQMRNNPNMPNLGQMQQHPMQQPQQQQQQQQRFAGHPMAGHAAGNPMQDDMQHV